MRSVYAVVPVVSPVVAALSPSGSARRVRSSGWCALSALLVLSLMSVCGTARAATFTVSTLADSGDGSLRQAITDANASAANDDITFSVTGTIRLLSTLSTIVTTSAAGTLSISNTQTGGVTISGDANNSGTNNDGDVQLFVVDGGANLSLNRLTLSGGRFSEGGAIRNFGTVSITGSTLSGNIASNGGGAILNSNGTVNITGSTLSGNTVNGNGGAIFNSGPLNITNSTLSGNTASEGGAIRNSSGTLSITSSTLSGNTASNGGGGISNADTLNLSNSIVAGNTAPTDPNINGSVNNQGNNLTSGDPKLGPLQDNGGPTFTRALLAGSPAIDAGNPNFNGAGQFDQRGTPFARVSGGRLDIGAFELVQVSDPTGAAALVVTTLSDVTAADGLISLREAILLANSDIDQSDITFNIAAGGSRVITLASTLPTLNTSMTISGPATGGVSVTRAADNTQFLRIFRMTSGTIGLNNLTISGGNAGNDDGGGIANLGAILTVTGCTITGNTAFAGGGVYSSTRNTFTQSSTTLRNCTITGNTATDTQYSGGGVHNFNGKTVLDSCTVVGNKAPNNTGAGLSTLADGTTRTEIGNCIIAGNLTNDATPATNTDVSLSKSSNDVPANFASQGNNLIGDGDAASRFTAPGDSANVADAALKLGALADNGGPTQTIALLTGSPAINTGSTALTTDQRGYGRDAAPDIGAFEVSRAPVNGTITPSSAIDAPNTPRTFTATYSDANGANDINLVALRIGGTASNSANSLLCVYNPVTNKLSIYNDAATALVGSVTPGMATVLSNSQGSLNCGATTVSKSGNVLTVNWNVSATGAFAGTRQTTFLFVRDTSGLIDSYTAKGTWTISGNTRPATLSASPATVTRAAGIEQFFTTKFNDPNGYKNLQFVTLRLGGSGTNSANAMVCVYNVQNNKLYLFDDAGNYVPQADFPGRATVLQNSQGSLNCARTTVTGSGNTLTVKWSVKAKAAFAGSRAIALLCADRANLRDGYDAYGTWTITGAGGAAASPAVSKASAAGDAVSLVFTGAAPQSGYMVAVNGASVEVTSVSVQGSKVLLSLAQASVAGDEVVVTWPSGSTSLTAD